MAVDGDASRSVLPTTGEDLAPAADAPSAETCSGVAPPAEPTPCRPDVSLVVSTVGRPDELRRLIDSIAPAAASSGPAVELIVVDQSPDGRCLTVLEAHAGRSRSDITWRHLRSSIGVSHGRNVGLAAATGDYVMFPDDDAWFGPDTLSRAVQHLAAHPEHAGLCTQLQDGHGLPSMLRWASDPGLVTLRNHHRTSIGSTMLFRREVALSIDGFDESMGPGAPGWHGSCEDADFLLRIIGTGARIWYEPSVIMNHRDSRWDGGSAADAKALSYGCGQGRLWRSHRFPPSLVAALVVRRLIGGTLWSLRGRPDIGRAHRAWVRGSLNGLVGRPPLDLDPVTPPASNPGSHAPTSAEFGRSLSWRLLVGPLGTVATFVLTAVVARTLSSGGVTVFYTLLAALMIGPIVGRFGLNQWAVRDLAALRTSGDLGAAVAVGRHHAVSVVGPATLAAPAIALVFIAGFAPGGFDAGVAVLATVILFAETWRLAIGDVLIGVGQTGWAAALAHQVRAVAVLGVVVTFIVLRPGRLDLDVLLWLMAGVSVVLVAAGLARLWTLPSHPVESAGLSVGGWIGRGLPFLVVDLVVVVVARSDIWLAALTLPDEVAARYGTASVVAALVGMPIGLASIALAPVVAGLGSQRRLDAVERLVRSLATVVAWVLVPFLAVVVLVGRPILEAAYGAPYGAAHPYLLVLLVGNLALALLGAAPTVLLMSGRQWEAMLLAVAWLALAAPVAIVAAIVGGATALAVASASTTVGLYALLAAATWVTTGIRLVPYLRPSAVRLTGDEGLPRFRSSPAPTSSLAGGDR